MQLEQHFELPVAPEAAWPAFADVELLVSCLPGASITGPAADGDWPLRFDVKLGPISAGFAGSGKPTLDDAERRGRFEGAAIDKRTQSRVKGAVAFALEAAGSGTRVSVDVDYALTGQLAQFSRGGLVKELASALTAQFAANLAARLQAMPAAAAVPAAVLPIVAEVPVWLPQDDPAPIVPPALPTAPARPAAAPLSAGSLLLQVLKARWRRLLDRLFRRAA
jgi:uncharacterized protein